MAGSRAITESRIPTGSSRARSSTFPSCEAARRAVFVAVSLALAVNASYPDADAFLGLSPREFFEKLRSKDTAFLLQYPVEELHRFSTLGENAVYYAGRAFEKAGSPERAAVLYELALKEARGMARREALRGAVRANAQAERWERVLEHLAVWRASYGDDPALAQDGAEALYRLERWPELLVAVAKFREKWPSDATRRIQKVLRWETVAKRMQGDAAWIPAFRSFVRDYVYTDDTRQAWNAIGDTLIRKSYKAADVEYMEFRLMLGAKENKRAWTWAEERLDRWLVPGASPQVASDVGKVALAADQGKACDAAFAALEKKVSKDTSGLLFMLKYYRGRFAEKAGDYEAAVTLFKAAALATTDPNQEKLALWYAADTLHTIDPVRSAAYLSKIAPTWTDTWYFSDVCDRTIAGLVAKGKWDELKSMYDAAGPYMVASQRQRMAYVLGRARQLGLWSKGARASDWFETAISIGGTNYFTYLSRYRLGAEPVVLPAFEKGDAPVATPSEAEAIRFFQPYVAWGLQDEAYAEIVAALDRLSDAEVRGLARVFEREGFYAETMRLVGKLMDRPGYVTREEDYRVIYPRYYLNLVEPLCARFGIDPIIWYGLMRTESYFDHDIVSWAGAIGLSQLMPSTAAAEAAGLGMTTYELTNPRDNLTIGISHFSGLMKATNGSVVRSLAAYNAGLSRVRRWEKVSGSYPDDLFAESFSIAETRSYNRFNLVATVVFGVLYSREKPSYWIARVLGEAPR